MPEYAPRVRRKKRKSRKSNGEQEQLPANASGLTVSQLQRTIGNRATADLLQRGVIQLTRDDRVEVVQREGQKLSQAEIKKRILAGQKRRQKEKEAKNSWLGYFASWVPGGYYTAAKDDDDDNDFKDTGYDDFEVAKFDSEEEPEDEPGPDHPFAPQQIVIDLGRTEYEENGTSIGNVKASGQQTLSGDGKNTYSGKASAEGSYGKGEAEGKMSSSAEELSGEGKLGFLFGTSNEMKTGDLGWGYGGQALQGAGKMESKMGLTGEASAKFASKASELGAEGKMGAMLGASAEGNIKIKILSNGKEVGNTEGKLGMTFGVGGEIGGKVQFKGGEITFSQEGKLAFGVGFSYGYSVTINTNALMEVAPSWMASIKYYMWDIWGELPDDFEPPMI